MNKLQHSQALTSYFESFWSIVSWQHWFHVIFWDYVLPYKMLFDNRLPRGRCHIGKDIQGTKWGYRRTHVFRNRQPNYNCKNCVQLRSHHRKPNHFRTSRHKRYHWHTFFLKKVKIEIGTKLALCITYLIEFITVLFIRVNLNSIWFRAILSLDKASKSQKG